MNRTEINITTSLIELHIINSYMDLDLIKVHRQLLLLGSALLEEQNQEMNDILIKFQDNPKILKSLDVDGEYIYYRLSDTVKPNDEIDGDIVKDKFLRRVILFKLYQEYRKNGGICQISFSLTEFAHSLGTTGITVLDSIEYLNDVSYLNYTHVNGNKWCHPLLEIKGIKLCENKLLLFDEFSEIKLPIINYSEKKIADTSSDPQKVWVVHGRNEKARKAIFEFLRSIGLEPIEWSEAVALTKNPSPYIGNILTEAFNQAQAVIVLLTGDDIAYLRTEFVNKTDTDSEKKPTPQARPNVLFEAGMAFGYKPDRTIFVQLGEIRPFSDISGILKIELNDSPQKRQELVDRLKTAGCNVDISNKKDWYTSGNFKDCIPNFKEEKKEVKNSISTKYTPSKDEIKILQLLAIQKDKRDEGQYPITAKFISIKFPISMTKIDYYLNKMEENSFIHKTLTIGGPVWIFLDKAGVDYLVENDLLVKGLS